MSSKKKTPNSILKNYLTLYSTKRVRDTCILEPLKNNKLLCGDSQGCVILNTKSFYNYLMYIKDYNFSLTTPNIDVTPIVESVEKSTYFKALGYKKGDLVKVALHQDSIVIQVS